MKPTITNYGSEVFRRPTADAKTQWEIEIRWRKRQLRNRPQVGDFVEFTDKTYRISHIWGNEDGSRDIQTSEGGSYYLHPSGSLSMSGELFPSIPESLFADTGEVKQGSGWLFYNDSPGASRGVYFTIPVKVWRVEKHSSCVWEAGK